VLKAEGKLLVYKRFDSHTEIIVILNPGKEPYMYDLPDEDTFIDLFENSAVLEKRLTIPPFSASVYRKSNP
jgi:hypothetical protein